MGDKDKKLCKLVKDDYLKDELNEYIQLVEDAKYVCRKCGRLAHKEKRLCKPEGLKK